MRTIETVVAADTVVAPVTTTINELLEACES